jgi:hypothetical protein
MRFATASKFSNSFCALLQTVFFMFDENKTSSPVVKLAGREADHSLPISVEGDNKWGYTSNPLQAVTVAQ